MADGLSALPVRRTPEAFARVGAVSLCYDTFGEDDAPPLLLIMGLGCQMTAWDDDFCAALTARGFRVIRFDNRDVGRSTSFDVKGVPSIARMFAGRALWGRGVPYLLRDMADDAVGLLDALGIARADVVGISMGGAIAQEMALRHRARLRTMTLIMAATGETGAPPTREAMAVLTRPPSAPGDYDAYERGFVHAWRVLRGGAFPDDEARDPQRARIAWDRGLNPGGRARQLAAVVASGSRRRALAGLDIPTLVMHGDRDPLVPIAHGEALARAIPGARYQVLRGMGHALPMAFWPTIIGAIADHAGRAAGTTDGSGP